MGAQQAALIGQILPAGVVAVETREDLLDIRLFAEEEAAVGNAVEKRRREFTTARACARAALRRLGVPPAPILKGERGEPCWPAGVVGSITHCNGYRACAVARSSEFVSVGIDVEPNAPMPERVLDRIANPQERAWLERSARAMPEVRWDRLLFSAKESIYKAWFPLARRWLGFEDAIVALDAHNGTFVGRLLVEGPRVGDVALTRLCGRWLACEGLVLSAIAIARPA